MNLSEEQIFGFAVLAVVLAVLGVLAVVFGLKLFVRAARRKEQGELGGTSEDYAKERHRILDMVEAGHINGSEAERLLSAMEQSTGAHQNTAPVRTVNWVNLIAGAVLTVVGIWLFSGAINYGELAAMGKRARVSTVLSRLGPEMSMLRPRRMPAGGSAMSVRSVVGLGIVPIGLIGLGLTALWLWMLIDCAIRSSDSFAATSALTSEGKYDKLVWLIAMLLFNVIATILYFFVVYRRSKRGAQVAGAV